MNKVFRNAKDIEIRTGAGEFEADYSPSLDSLFGTHSDWTIYAEGSLFVRLERAYRDRYFFADSHGRIFIGKNEMFEEIS